MVGGDTELAGDRAWEAPDRSPEQRGPAFDFGFEPG
jgi:hypothetical protein